MNPFTSEFPSRDELLRQLHITRERQPVRAWLAALTSSAYGRLSRCAPDFLTASDLARWSDFPTERRRVSFLLGRYAAKRAAGAYLGTSSLADLELANGVFQQPILRFPARDLPHLTLCHTADLVFAVAYQADHIFGIDAEPIVQGRCEVLRPHMTQAECERLRQLGLDEVQRLFLLWTAKEALSKALRCGLTLPFPLLELNGCALAGPGDYACTFTNFGQYQARCALIRGTAVALTLPKGSVLHDSLPGLLATSLMPP